MSPEELKRILAQNPELTVREYANQGGSRPVAPVTQVTADTNPLAQKFEALWQEWNGPELQREYRFDSVRKWRLDYFFEGMAYQGNDRVRVGIELEGGLYAGGRHQRLTGYRHDIEKYNAATMRHGIVIIRLGSGMIDSGSVGEIVDYIHKRLIGRVA